MKLKAITKIVVVGLSLWCFTTAEGANKEIVADSVKQIGDFHTTTVKSPEDLRTFLRAEQKKYLLLAPPSIKPYWSTRNDDVFVDWLNWSELTRKRAVATLDENLIPRYEFHIWEDPQSGAIIIENAYHEIIAKLQPEKGFNSLGWAMRHFGVSKANELSNFQQIIYASHHTALSLILTPVIFEKVCAELRKEELILAAQESAMAPLVMMSLPASPTNLVLSINNSTNANSVVEIEIGYPETFTNRVEIYATTNLSEGAWQIISSALVTTGNTSLVWSDTQTNLQFRAYRVGNADLDSDGDGLIDAKEILLYGTNPNNFDSDGDFMGDAWELQHSLNPNDNLDMILDPDHDMLPNVYECYYGLNPNSADSSSITKLRVDPSNASLSNTYATIQEAFNASTNYSIIEVAEGTYGGITNVGLFFPAHPVMLMSDNWGTSKTTIVEYDGDFAAFLMDESQDNRTIVRGLTVRLVGQQNSQIGFRLDGGLPYSPDGAAPYLDGITMELGESDQSIGFLCMDASNKRIFNNCVIRGRRGVNTPQYGIYLVDSSPVLINNCTFQDFAASPYSYGIFFKSTLENYGGASDPTDVNISNCAWDESFAVSNAECFVRIENGIHYNVVVSNSIMPKTPSWFPPDSQSNLYITNSLLSMGAHLNAISPGVGRGIPSLTWYDFEGQARDGNTDIGADEYAGFSTGDSDGDGLSDIDEATIYFTDMYRVDSDGDGFDDNIEISLGTSPTNAGNYQITISGTATNLTGHSAPLFVCCSNKKRVWDATSSTMISPDGTFLYSNYIANAPTGLWVQVYCDSNTNSLPDTNEPIYTQKVIVTGSTYQCSFVIRDLDGDGVSDWDEINCATDPYDPANYCLTINGSVSNDIPFDAALGVTIGTDPTGFSNMISTNVTTNNTFHIDHLEITSANPLWLHLFNDLNSNAVYDANELSVASTLIVTDAVMSVVLELSIDTADNDDDSIVDFWEQIHGLSWTNQADAYLDPDADGLYNLHEYWAGTDMTISNSNYAISDAMFAVDKKIEGLNPINSIKIFSIEDHANGIYERNTNCWAAAYDLTCCSPWNSFSANLRAGTLISPRHVLFAAHFDQIPVGHVIRFVDRDNNIIERTLIGKMRHPNYNIISSMFPDLTVGLLSSDVPASSIKFAKILPDNYKEYIWTGNSIPALCLDQEEKVIIADINDVRWVAGEKILSKCQYPQAYARSQYSDGGLINNDSGNPGFLIIGQEAILLTVWTGGGPGGGTSIVAFKGDLNAIMAELDLQHNVTSGYQLTEYDLSAYTQIVK